MRARAKRIKAEIEALIADDDVQLLEEAPAWLRSLRLLYEIALLCAAVASAWLLLEEGSAATAASWLIWFWFAADYSVRVFVAEDRADYVRNHRLELLAAMPFEVFRPLRLLRLLRPLAILMRATKGLRDVLGLTGVGLIAAIGTVIVCLGGAVYAWIEPDAEITFADGVWWAVVTTTTVGYGDISPVTTGGRILGGVLMVSGIGLLGALTGEVALRFLNTAQGDASSGDADVDHLAGRVAQWPELTAPERQRVVTMLSAMIEEPSPTGPTPATEGR